MTLEDFFTLTEMKDGLTIPSRVEELVSVMKDKDCAVKNVCDATRQWAAVASTIAATENKECLDLFIQLDGLWFIDKWLKEVQTFCIDSNEGFVEESITALLQALEKLHKNNERSISSGIWTTVKRLLGHKSSKVQDSARLLLDSWKQERDDGDAVNSEVENVALLHDDGSSKVIGEDDKPSDSGIPSSEEGVKGEARTSEHPIEETRSSEIKSERVEDIKIPSHNNQPDTSKVFDSADIKVGSAVPPASSTVSTSVQENPFIKENSPVGSLGRTTSSENCSSVIPNKGAVEGQPDFPKVDELSSDEMEVDKVENSVSGPLEPGSVASGADAASTKEFVKQPDSKNDFEAKENDVNHKVSATDGAVAPASDSKNGMAESRSIDQSNVAQDGECCSTPLQDSSGDDSILGKPEDLETSSKMDALGAIDEDKEHASDEVDYRNAYNFSKPVMDSKNTAVKDKRSNMDLDYGVDALEVARQVAKAVEREAKGPYCSSSSEKTSGGGPKEPASPDSINKKDLPTEVPLEEMPTAQSHSAVEGHTSNEANLDTAPENCNRDMDSSQATEAAQETEIKTEGFGGFDLNLVCADEMDRPLNPVSAPIPVSSRPSGAPGLPAAPIQFEGTLGWKGSAATSAFRPASPRRNSDSDKNHSVGGNSDSSKQRPDFLDIDLNVAEDGDDLGKQIPASSGLPSGESSVEVSPKRSDRLHLDLNRMDDDSDVLPSDLRAEGHHAYNRNGHRSPSPASSSSSMQPSLRNFDLNDRPSLLDSFDQGSGKSSQPVNAYAMPNPDGAVISIMGTRVEINNRKDVAPQGFSLSNGKTIEPATDATVARKSSFLGLGTTGSYSPVFGYNGLTVGTTMSFNSGMYPGPGGAIPVMVDSRATVMAPMLPSASTVHSYPLHQQPFFMNMGNAQQGINGPGTSRPNFDLNSGFMVEGGNRESGLMQLFGPGQGRSMEEHLRTNSQPPSSSGIGGKRKEPDAGWDSYQLSYKQPPWR
ncbi:hypothetical protein UlMin_034069 [Ulmus minor]